MASNQNDPRRTIAEAFIRMVADDLIPAETAAESLHQAYVALRLDVAEVTRLVAAAVEASVAKAKVDADVHAIWDYVPDEFEYGSLSRSGECEVADSLAERFGREYEAAVAALVDAVPLAVSA